MGEVNVAGDIFFEDDWTGPVDHATTELQPMLSPEITTVTASGRIQWKVYFGRCHESCPIIIIAT